MTIIRPERPADFPAIYALVRDAFHGEPHAEGDEQDFVNRQRASESYVPALALVAEDEGQLVGYVMMTRIRVTGTENHELLLLAALAVLRQRRRKGIGTRLVEQAIERARQLDFRGAIVLGDPAYYSRLGFLPSVSFSITNTNGFESQYCMARELVRGGMQGVSGLVTLPA